MKRGFEELIFLTVLAALLIVAGALIFPAVTRTRSNSSQNSCVNNLWQIEGAKQQWALAYHKATNDVPSWADIQPFLERGGQGGIPTCPRGGTYILARVDELPRCSIGGPDHSLPQETFREKSGASP
jgi:hypothetical protein